MTYAAYAYESRAWERPRRRRDWSWVKPAAVLIVLGAAGIIVGSQVASPESGLLTRLIDGNAIADEDAVARNAFDGGKSVIVVAGSHKYQFIFPGHTLTYEQEVAVSHWAHRHQYPVFASMDAADGPLAVDP
jgi:hypothetical protein